MKIIPVIHHLNDETTLKNAAIAQSLGVFGVFLISMSGDNKEFPFLAKTIKGKYPQLKVGINLLGCEALSTLETSKMLGLDMSWSDNPIVTSQAIHPEATKISLLLRGTNHMFFNSVAFKYQALDNNPQLAAQYSSKLGFIPTTSGEATGKAANLDKIISMKNSIPNGVLAVASGLTPENSSNYKKYVDYGLVCTGISKSYYEFDPIKIEQIIKTSS